MLSKKIFSIAFLLGVVNTVNVQSQIPRKGDTSIAWMEGYLDLHHINTGRGDVAYYIFPDGTTLLFDAGEQDPTDPRTNSARNSVIRPNNSTRAVAGMRHER